MVAGVPQGSTEMRQKQTETSWFATLDPTAGAGPRRGLRALRRAAIACGLALLLAAQCGYGQTPQSALQTGAAMEDALHAMVLRAAVIFTGQVVGVRRHDGDNGATGTVEIEFAVEDPVRGVSGGTYTLHEWAGLWPAGDQPFRPGQSFLMLLHAPGASGLSSPVGGMDGAIPIRGSGAASPATATGGRVVDLRWIQTRTVRPVSYRVTEHGTALPVPTHPEAIVSVGPPLGEADPVILPNAQVAAATIVSSLGQPYATVLTLLRAG